jgi:hypothetical protein
VARFRVRAVDDGDELLVIHDGAVVPAERRGDEVTFHPDALGTHALVTCTRAACALVDTLDVPP